MSIEALSRSVRFSIPEVRSADSKKTLICSVLNEFSPSQEGLRKRRISAEYPGSQIRPKRIKVCETFRGNGICTYLDGSFYRGGWVDNKRHGEGALENFDRSYYKGSWVNDIREGKGTLIYSDGSYYEGDWVKDQREGKGIEVQFNENGFFCRYEGEWKNDRKEGVGKLIGTDGSYTGDWQDGMRHGNGRRVYLDGTIYEGQWANNKRNGKGILTVPGLNLKFEGDWVDGRIEGGGILIKRDESYEGEFFNNMKHGRGKYTCLLDPSLVFEGDWVNNAAVSDASNLGDHLFYTLLCGSHRCPGGPPKGYCLGIMAHYLLNTPYWDIALDLDEAFQLLTMEPSQVVAKSEEISNLLASGKGSKLIVSGSENHDVGLNLVAEGNSGFVLLEIFNSGLGLDLGYHKKHPTNPRKYQTKLQIRVSAKSLTKEVIQSFLSKSNFKTMNDFYGTILNLSGATIVESKSSPWKSAQKGDDCSLQWIFSLCKDKKPEQYPNIIAKLKSDCCAAHHNP